MWNFKWLLMHRDVVQPGPNKQGAFPLIKVDTPQVTHYLRGATFWFVFPSVWTHPAQGGKKRENPAPDQGREAAGNCFKRRNKTSQGEEGKGGGRQRGGYNGDGWHPMAALMAGLHYVLMWVITRGDRRQKRREKAGNGDDSSATTTLISARRDNAQSPAKSCSEAFSCR